VGIDGDHARTVNRHLIGQVENLALDNHRLGAYRRSAIGDRLARLSAVTAGVGNGVTALVVVAATGREQHERNTGTYDVRKNSITHTPLYHSRVRQAVRLECAVGRNSPRPSRDGRLRSGWFRRAPRQSDGPG